MQPFEILLTHDRFREGRDYHRQFLDEFLPEGTIGDIGCGTGRIAACYESPKRKVISIDNDEEMITAVSALLPESEFIVGNAYDLPLPDASLDAYIGLGIFELDGEGGRRGAKEAARVTKPGGLLYLTVPYKNAFRKRGRKAMWRGLELPSFSSAEMRELLKPHGFEVILTRPSSIAHGLGPLRRLASIFPTTLAAEDERSWGYRFFGHRLKPFANSLLVVARKAQPTKR